MIDVRTISYRVVAVTPDGTQLDISPAVTNLGWEEGERELSARISMRLQNAYYKGKKLSEMVVPNTPIFVYAYINGIQTEVVRGQVGEWDPNYSNADDSVELTAYDEMIALRRNQDDRYYTDGTGSKPPKVKRA